MHDDHWEDDTIAFGESSEPKIYRAMFPNKTSACVPCTVTS